MAVFSIILKSQLEGAKRLDAEYYQPEFLDMTEKIKKFKNYSLEELITNFNTGKNLKQSESFINSVKFIRTQNVRPILIDKHGLTSLDKAVKKYYKLSDGELLFVRVGEGVGNSSVVTPDFSGDTISDNVISVKINGNKINPYFVSIFLNSKFGYLSWERVSKGTARPLISSENINSIKIPFISEEENIFCQKIVLKANKLIHEGENFYSQAENLLLQELGLIDYGSAESLCGVVNLSEVKKNRRMDAEFFTSGWQALERKLKNTATKKLGELAEITKGIEPGAEEYKETGKQFIRVSSLSKEGINQNDQKFLDDELYQKLKKDYEPQVGEILLTKDATPGIAHVLNENLEAIVAGGILRLKLKEKIEAEYLALVLNSLVGQAQAERDAGGSVIKHWKPEQIKNVLIPIISNDKQKIISDLVKKSFEAKKKSKELLDEAKSKVEEMIENN